MTTAKATIGSLAHWFGTDRLICREIANHLDAGPFEFVGFAGGMSILQHLIGVRTIFISDLHHDIINLIRVVKDDAPRPMLLAEFEWTFFQEETHSR